MPQPNSITNKCSAKEHCVALSKNYPYKFKPVCPVLKGIFDTRKLEPNLPKGQSLKNSVYRLAVVSYGISALLPNDFVFGFLAHRTEWLDRILATACLDLETLPKQLEKNYPQTSREIKQLARSLMEQFSEYEERVAKSSPAYALPSESGQTHLTNFIEWLYLTDSPKETQLLCWPYSLDMTLTAQKLLLELVGLDRAISMDNEQFKKDESDFCRELLVLSKKAFDEVSTPASDVEKDAGKRNKLVGEWSKPMSKTEMMRRLGIDSDKSFKAFTIGHPIKQLGSQKQWSIHLDRMNAKDREKLENA